MIVFIAAFLLPANSYAAVIDYARGYILLQVEKNGEAWYVNPNDNSRYYMKDGAVAYQMMRNFGLGITDADLEKIPSVADTTEMKNSSSICYSNSLANRVKGKILLQVQQHGEAWYVYPKTCRRIYMKDGEAAYNIMRFLGLGVSDANLSAINCDGDFQCLLTPAASCKPAKITMNNLAASSFVESFIYFFVGGEAYLQNKADWLTIDEPTEYAIKGYVNNKCILESVVKDYNINFGEKWIAKVMEDNNWTREQSSADLQAQVAESKKQVVGSRQICRLNNAEDMTTLINAWASGTYGVEVIFSTEANEGTTYTIGSQPFVTCENILPSQ
ncbi:MAG: hypothetical protein A2Y82_04845 [Candidatus Buchananbacteria bacterium RBG_13_36_9]|uniref:Uncharacterized protein n=1 Tax=Candidatus Buchananbacteria bacterium RBG_13_36_9 TaxID=1797530 RepID=A0A1G1XQB0_9BACT|nr:MAG: hypothetical protein A2Y82_04845 [Candidatus Buchananbacteria bacterium RBG_13_36_9]